MSKHRRSVQVAGGGAPKLRQGEGVPIDISVINAIGTSGVLGVGLDLSRARVPDRRYAADACSIVRARGSVKLMFGQERVDGQGWRTLLVIAMNETAIVQFLQAVSAMTNPTLEQIVAASNLQAEPLSEKVTEPGQPNQAISLIANLGILAISGTEACMDFYHVSAFALGALRGATKTAVDPVVRVDLRTTLLLGLISALRALDLQEPSQFFALGSTKR